MNRIVVSLEDRTLNVLMDRAEGSHRSLEQEAALALQAAVTMLPPGGQSRVVVMGPAVLQGLEDILGGGSVLNDTDLLQKVQRLAGVSFLHVRLPFTPNQLEALAEKAARQGMSVEQLVNRTAPRIYEHFFDLLARV